MNFDLAKHIATVVRVQVPVVASFVDVEVAITTDGNTAACVGSTDPRVAFIQSTTETIFRLSIDLARTVGAAQAVLTRGTYTVVITG